MNITAENKKYVYLIIIGVVILGILLLIHTFISLRNKKVDVNNTTLITPSTLPTNKFTSERGQQYDQSEEIISTKNKEVISHDEKVSNLLNIVPYKGKNFTFDFNYKTAKFTVAINQNAKEAGLKEFNSFLQQHSIDSPSWIFNLVTVYK